MRRQRIFEVAFVLHLVRRSDKVSLCLADQVQVAVGVKRGEVLFADWGPEQKSDT